MKWIVLSDLHMLCNNFDTKDAQEKLLAELRKMKGQISFVIITGDCFNQSKGDEEQIANFIKKIAKCLGVHVRKIVLCPGNHDVDRLVVKRAEAIREYRETGKIPDINTCQLGYDKFNTVHMSLYNHKYKPFNCKSIGIFQIINVDSCLLSLDNDDYGKLTVNFPELWNLGGKMKNCNKINIVVMHHGVEWLEPRAARRFQHWLADNNVKMVFCGHNHAPGMNILTEAIPKNGIAIDGVPQYTCGCVLSDNYSSATFLLGEYNEEDNDAKTEKQGTKITIYEYKKDSEWEIANGLLRSFEAGVFRESKSDGLIKGSYDIPIVYKSIYDLPTSIEEEIMASKKLNFYGIKGKIFLAGNSIISKALYSKKNKIAVRILVSDPYNKNIKNRLKNVEEFSEQNNLEMQWKTIYESIKELKDNFPMYNSWQLRFHEEPLYFRFIMTDSNVYLSYYTEKPSSESNMYCYTNKSFMYKDLEGFFKLAWKNAKTKFSSVVPDRCSFVLERFTMKPSLVINLTSSCNMNCKYCPEGGENLKKCEKLCDIEQIKYLISSYADYYKENEWTEKKVLRITGGEPLLVEQRLSETLKHAKKEEYEKIVLCTNGTMLKKCYEEYTDVWESVKNILLLKISLDSLKPDVFKELTGTNMLDDVLDNISFAKQKGFKIELNFVAKEQNINEIEEIFDYAKEMNLVGVKVLTVNDFGGRVEPDNVETQLKELIKKLRNNDYQETDLYVHNNKGIYMKRFTCEECTLTIVDHMNGSQSVTPRRTYSEACKFCEFYPDSPKVKNGKNKPCATGIMSLTMRADGMLSFCRMKDRKNTCLNGMTKKEVKEVMKMELDNFKKCYHYAIGEKK